jgi:hypothetical protein
MSGKHVRQQISRAAILPTVLLLGLSACDKPPMPSSSTDPVDTAQLQTRLASLTHQVDSATAVHSIKRLQWAYGHYSELGLWYDFADLFANSGIGHYVQGDLNRDQIRALFFDQVGQGRLGLAQGRIYPHISFSPVIDLADDGQHANARFRILAMLGGYGGNATWFHGVYENAYVQEQGVWKLNAISNTAQVSGSFKAGLSAQSKAPLDVPTFAFHFAPEQVGRINIATSSTSGGLDAPANADANSNAQALATYTQLAASLLSQQQRLTRLQDEAAIVNLQHQYGYYLDQHNWDALVELFAENASFESGQQGVYNGKASIRNALNQYGSQGLVKGEVDEHILLQPYVSVAADGQSAKARVDQLGLQGNAGQSAEWTQGIYENSFVKENGQWRIQTLHYYPRLITDYAKGWGVDAQPAPGPNNDYPADAPPTERYEIFPTFYIPAFHFTHPVTGRAPQYPAGDPASTKPIDFNTTLPPATTANSLTDNANLPTQLATAELQAEQLLAGAALENLVNAYAYYLDECMPQQAATLFAEQGVNEIPGIGYYQGPQRIAQALQLAYCPNGRQEGAFTLHHAVQPVITVADDGQSATIVTRLWQVRVAGKADDGQQDDYYLMGQLQGQAIKQNSQWKLASLSTQYSWVAGINEGWAHATTNEALGYAAPVSMLTELPPDRAATPGRLAPYP